MPVLLFLYALALVVRLVLVALFPDPAYPDSYYYVAVARSLADGRGLNVDFVWIFAEVGGRIPAEPVLPIPSNAHWLPLASFVQAPFLMLLGPSAFAAALPAALIGATAAPLTWVIARDAGASSTVALAAGVLAAVPAAGTVFMAQPENFAIFMPLVAATLWLAARGLRGDGRSFAASGLLCGLASLGRNDAYFLGAAVGLVFVLEQWRARRAGRVPRLSLGSAAACLGLFLLVVTPWWLRQLAVFGSIAPTASGGQALWLTDYSQWNSITAAPSLESFLGQGWDAVIASRLSGLTSALANFAVVIGSIVLVPLMLIGAWHRRRSESFQPWFIYTAVLFAAATIIFPLHVRGGAFIHSAVGLAPAFFILAMEGAERLAGRLSSLLRPAASVTAPALLCWALVIVTVGSAALSARAVHAGWNETRAPRQAFAEQIDALGVARSDRLMSVDAAGINYFTGRPGVVTPNDPLATIEEVARAYDIRWLVLERDKVVPALLPVLSQDQRPAWIGPRAYAVPSVDGHPALALYPVCMSTFDGRCSHEART